MSHYTGTTLHTLKLGCAFLTLIYLGCDGSSAEAKKAKHLERAATYFEKGQYHESIIEYRNVTQLDAKDADAHYRLALAYLKLGGLPNLQAAFAELTRTVELDKTNQEAQLKLGELYLLGNEPGKARERAEVVLVSAPQNTEGLILKGRSLAGEKRYKESIEDLKSAITTDPNRMQTYIDLSRVYFSANDRESAERVLNQALKINPRSTEILTALGDFRESTGKVDQAEQIFKQILDNEPGNEAIHLRLSELYLRRNRLTEAEDILQKLTAAKPQDEIPLIRLGDFYVATGNSDKALASYQRALNQKQDSLLARDKLISLYLDTKKLDEATAHTKQVLDKNGKDLSGRFFDARIRLAKGLADEAIPLLQGVIKDEPQFAGAHHFLGVAYLQKRDLAQARASFNDAIKYNPRLGEARTALAQLYLADNSTALALEQAQAAIQINPRNIQAALVAGSAYLKKGDLPKSRQVFEAIAQSLPKEPIGPYHLGLVSRAEKNEAKALAYFEEALKRKPSAIEPIAQIVMIKTAQKKSDEARARVVRQLDQAPQSPLLHNLLGQLWAHEKNYAQAEQEFRKAIELNDALFPAYLNLAGIYLQMDKLDQAIKEYGAVLEKNPKAIQAHMMLGMIHEGRNEFDKAQARYETILKLNPRFVPAANNLAWILAQQGGNLDVALAHAQTAREGNPDDPRIADTLGWVYYKKNAFLLAVNLLKEAVEKLPNEPAVHYHYGMALAKNNNASEAKKALQTALKLNARFDGAEEARKMLEGL
jgi:tetratricopeptide (TPR) repeat protein